MKMITPMMNGWVHYDAVGNCDEIPCMRTHDAGVVAHHTVSMRAHTQRQSSTVAILEPQALEPFQHRR